MANLNKILFRLLFITISILWLKCIWDILHAYEIWDDASFPLWFNILFIGAGLAIIPFALWCTTKLHLTSETRKLDYLLWASIPLVLLCVCPVCYRGNILQSGYEISTYLRRLLLVAPVILGILYFGLKKKSLAITLLLVIGFISLIPNDGCNNQFNYWYVKRIGLSPLMYVPVVMNILLLTAAYFGKNKRLMTALAFLVCIGCLIISFGHRLKVLW